MLGVNENRVKLWIGALRSGEYTQCQHVLEYIEMGTGKTSHCCLGVAQRVALANGYIDQGEDDLDWGAEGLDADIALNWFGFSDQVGSTDPGLGNHDVGGEIVEVSCVKANDELGWTFEQIADSLQEQYITPADIEREA